MKELLATFENKEPEITFEWHDSETEAVGWVVINSLRGGAAGGGTRMRVGLDKREVSSLAKTMEVKFTVSGPAIGGAKSGINFNPNDPRKKEVLARWYKAVSPLLKNYYGTGGDLNVDEIHEVIPITEENGVWHPQEGVLTGHFAPTEAEKIKRIGRLRYGVKKEVFDAAYTPDPLKKYTVADLITGYGVAMSVVHHYNLRNENIKNKRVLVQGWGNVGAAAAYYLAAQGALVTGIIDIAGGIINKEGLGLDAIKQLFEAKSGNKLNAPNLIAFEEANNSVWDCGAEIFIPCAASRLVTQNQIERLIKGGLEVVSCGANVPFADKEIFYGPIAEFTDNNVSLIPDFISNCGMARVFAYLMSDTNTELSDKAIFNDTSTIIKNALEKVLSRNSSKTEISKTAYEIALIDLI